MITLEQFLNVTNYSINGSSPYQWKCYGPAARWLDCGGESIDDWNASVVFDTVTREIYCAEVCDPDLDRYYRLHNPVHRSAYLDECKTRNIDPDEATDTKKFIELELVEDWLEKAAAIVNGYDYDTRVLISIDMDDQLLLDAMLAAHGLDITFNQYIERALQAAVDAADERTL